MSDGELFDRSAERTRGAPLAERLRPRTLDEVVGQTRVLGAGSLLRKLVQAKRCPSLIFWGPPGVGKTTIARIIAKESGSRFETMSAVAAGWLLWSRRRPVIARNLVYSVSWLLCWLGGLFISLDPHFAAGRLTLVTYGLGITFVVGIPPR